MRGRGETLEGAFRVGGGRKCLERRGGRVGVRGRVEMVSVELEG